MLRRLEQIDADDPDIGGKASGLARLVAAGLPVPPTLVLPASARRAPWAEVAAALAPALATLGAPLVVRSSATCEDRAAAAAPGLFLSRAGVRTPAALADAVRAVWASLESPIVDAYLRRRGVDPAAAGMAVVLQPELRGHASGTIYTRRPGGAADDEMLLEVGGVPALLTRAGRALTPLPAPLVDAELDALVRLALAAEAAIGAGATGADVEWVLSGDHAMLVQARAIVASARRATAATFEASAREPDVVWRWDAAHNPEPLSPAQAGLVALVDAEGVAPYRQAVLDGYLYFAERAGRGAAGLDVPADDLRRRYDTELRPALEHALAPGEAATPATLDVALGAYVDFYAGYARLSVPLRRARDALVAWLAARVGPSAPGIAARLLGAIGAAHTPERVPLAWDLVADELAGRTRRVRAPVAETAVEPLDLPEPVPAELLAHARIAAAIAEEDDALFTRAQALVRRAIAALARAWDVALDDLLHLPFDELRRAAAAGRPPADLVARAALARRERTRQAASPPPSVVVGGRGLDVPDAALGAHDLLRGWGAGGRVRGRVHRLAADAQAADIVVPEGAVVVAATILPGMALLVDGAAALVAEHGGPLGHGAALARELGLPFVVGCRGALTHLGDGAEVLVDGAAGLVLKLTDR